MNIQAVLVETAVGRRLMSNFHGMYSLGAISGALVLTGLLSLGLAPEVGSFMMIGVIVAANWPLRAATCRIARPVVASPSSADRAGDAGRPDVLRRLPRRRRRAGLERALSDRRKARKSPEAGSAMRPSR